MADRPYVWQMIKEAVGELGGRATYADIRKFIKAKYGDVNENTIGAQIIVCTVNQPSRIHYPENSKPRIADSRYDFLFSLGRGLVEFYDPDKHGIWEIRKGEYGKLEVAQAGLDEAHGAVAVESELGEEQSLLFPIESHLRDFIAKNIRTIEISGQKLKLYTDETGRDGIEYPTGVGLIDILAIDGLGNLVAFELKLSRGIDSSLGQLLRYMGWLKANMAEGKEVKGVIVARDIDNKLKYAASMTPDISLFEYELSFKINEVSI